MQMNHSNENVKNAWFWTVFFVYVFVNCCTIFCFFFHSQNAADWISNFVDGCLKKYMRRLNWINEISRLRHDLVVKHVKISVILSFGSVFWADLLCMCVLFWGWFAQMAFYLRWIFNNLQEKDCQLQHYSHKCHSKELTVNEGFRMSW